jgi:protein-S-isoprenylcysteine O-methyltransferase Ste14
MRKRFDFWSVVVVVLTLALFIMSLFQKGLTHDILLESGVFLVSVKLILMSHKSRTMAGEIEDRLEEIKSMLRSMQDQRPA